MDHVTRRNITPLGVARADSVGAVSTRALLPIQAELVRERLQELLTEHGSQKEVERVTGIKQQQVGKILNRDSIAGYATATKVAEADRLPVDALLSPGVPRALYSAMRVRRWSEGTILAAAKMAPSVPRARHLTIDQWIDVLEQVEGALGSIKGPRR